MRSRQLIAGVLVGLACVSMLGATASFWANRNLLDTGVWVQRTAPTIDEPALQEAIVSAMTNQIMTVVDPKAIFESALPPRGQILAVPLSSAVEDFVRDRVAEFVADDLFHQMWNVLVSDGHAAAVRVVLHAFVQPLLTTTGWVPAALAVIVAVLVSTGPYDWVVTLRRTVADLARGAAATAGSLAKASGGAVDEFAHRDGTTDWVAHNATALQWTGVAVGIGVLWFRDLSWHGLLAVAAVIGAAEFLVHRIAAHHVPDPVGS